jgi:hypothetical protein
MIAEKYIPHIQKLIENPEVSDFATTVYKNTVKLIEGDITQAQFDDGDYLIVFDSEFQSTKDAKNAINYIKQQIANDPNTD